MSCGWLLLPLPFRPFNMESCVCNWRKRPTYCAWVLRHIGDVHNGICVTFYSLCVNNFKHLTIYSLGLSRKRLYPRTVPEWTTILHCVPFPVVVVFERTKESSCRSASFFGFSVQFYSGTDFLRRTILRCFVVARSLKTLAHSLFSQSWP